MGAAAGIAFSWRGLTGNSRDSHKLLRFALEPRPSAARSTAFHRGPGAGPASGASPASMLRGSWSAFPRPGSDPTPAAAAGPDPLPRPPPRPRGPDLQFRLAHAIFRAYFEEDRDLSDRGALADIGAAATGYPAAEVRACVDDLALDEDAGVGGEGTGGERRRSGDKGRRGKDKRREYGYGYGDDRMDEGPRSRHREGGGAAAGEFKAESGAGTGAGTETAGTETEGGGGGGGGLGWGRTVDALEADVRARGIAAVPTIIVQDRYLAGGWQEARLFVELFEGIKRGEAGHQQTRAAAAVTTP